MRCWFSSRVLPVYFGLGLRGLALGVSFFFWNNAEVLVFPRDIAADVEPVSELGKKSALWQRPRVGAPQVVPFFLIGVGGGLVQLGTILPGDCVGGVM